MNNKYSILIARYLSGEASETERRELEHWISLSEVNRRVFEEARGTWQRTPSPQPDSIPPFEEFWQAMDTRLKTMKAPEKQDSAVSSGLFGDLISAFFRGNRTGYAWAAAASVVVVLALSALFFLNKGADKSKLQTIAAEYAERTSVELPDGSVAELNSGSRIVFPERFADNKRLVKFSGQAYFKIKKNGSPFVIETGNAEIRVLGTQFDVKAREGQTEVIVKEGSVSFKPLTAPTDSALILKANEKSICKGNMAPKAVDRVNADNAIAWLKHKLVFKKTPLNEIAGELERTFNKKITLSGRDMGEMTLTGEFRDQDLEQILSSICLTLNLKSRKVNDGYLISR